MLSTTLEPGFCVGKYKVLTHLATGGMGAVYKAMDLELRRLVALKVLKEDLARKSVVLDRFRREARHAARLSHPHIVTLFECGHDATLDLHFLTMEFIDGIDLNEYIKRKVRLEPDEARCILIHAAKALEHAYAKGVVHRDIKPSNILLARAGSKVIAKLTDLGLALVDDEEFKITREGCTVGTIDYMSPEQARDSRSADVRSDIYSLGCTGFHMLTGRAPFGEGGLGERLVKHLEAPPPDVRAFNPAVSASFYCVLLRMLAKKPEDRYPTPAALLVDLRRIPALVETKGGRATVLQRSGRRETVVDSDPAAPVLQEPVRQSIPSSAEPATPTTASQEQTRAAALYERAVQVLAQGGGNDYARQLLVNCLDLDPFAVPYRKTLREVHQQLVPGKVGRWLGALNVLAIKAKLHKARLSGAWHKVLEHGEEVLVQQPADVGTHLEMAVAAQNLKQPHLAAWLLEQGLERAPTTVSLMRALAQVHEQQQEWKAAVALWQQIDAIEPDHPTARHKINELSAQDHLAGGCQRR